jgi:cytidine deaminase
VGDVQVERLLELAWTYRERALVPRRASLRTRVGAAALADDGTTYGGCNVQQRFHSHDVHAELNAITTMIAEGRERLLAIAVVAELWDIAPCGSCLDWILQLGGDDCLVVWQRKLGGAVERHSAVEMMPFHPGYGREDDSQDG